MEFFIVFHNYPFYTYKVCSSSFSFQILLICTTSFFFVGLDRSSWTLLILCRNSSLFHWFFSIVLLVSISLNSALLSLVSTACFGFSLFKFLEVGTWIIDLRFSLLPKACSQCYNSPLSHALAVCVPHISICFIFI